MKTHPGRRHRLASFCTSSARVAGAALLLSAFLVTGGGGLRAQTTTETFNYSPNLPIPDNSITGASDSRTLSSSIGSITSLRVTLDITGGFNGDFYAYLVHTDNANNTGFAVLLNRVGRTALNSFGYADGGFSVTFSDTAPNGDIHTYPSPVVPPGPLTGLWQPDGRNVDPSLVQDTDMRSAFLSSFNGLNASGTWTLLVADLSPVGSGTFANWGLEITGVIVPEPATTALLLLGGGGCLLLAAGRRRWRRR